MDEVLNGMAVCAGGGGLELGIKLALGERYRCCVYVERETTAAGVLVKGMEAGSLDTAPIWDDFNTFPNREWRGLVDIISAGIPCQPFSVAGARRGADDSRNGWPALSRMVFDIAPSIVFVENVASADLLWYYYSEIRPCFHAMGYSTEEGIFTAEEVGSPHLRERLYIFAVHDSHRQRLPRRKRGGVQGAGRQLQPAGPLDHAWPPGPEEVSLVPRMADGLAFRAHRLHVLGNGVLPVVAAHAWLTLSARLGIGG